jgi:(E)-4-hydroxy-3-methylbut-2-enyl-diphosphate synthase
MVESAMEFLRICRDHDYHDIVLSMKASNTRVMVQAYRLLMNHMMREGMNYPLHLGVTEAGEGEDGRIKSAVGIGTLLEDGLGDTVRVSLTEAPEAEIPVAQMLVERYASRLGHDPIPEFTENPIDPFAYRGRHTHKILNFGDGQAPCVVGDVSGREHITPAAFFGFGYNYSVPLDKWNIGDQAADYLFAGRHHIGFEIPGTLGIVLEKDIWEAQKQRERTYPVLSLQELSAHGEIHPKLNFAEATAEDLYKDETLNLLAQTTRTVLVMKSSNAHASAAPAVFTHCGGVAVA